MLQECVLVLQLSVFRAFSDELLILTRFFFLWFLIWNSLFLTRIFDFLKVLFLLAHHFFWPLRFFRLHLAFEELLIFVLRSRSIFLLHLDDFDDGVLFDGISADCVGDVIRAVLAFLFLAVYFLQLWFEHLNLLSEVQISDLCGTQSGLHLPLLVWAGQWVVLSAVHSVQDQRLSLRFLYFKRFLNFLTLQHRIA